MNTILTDIRALSTISSTSIGLVREQWPEEARILTKSFLGENYKLRVNGHPFVKVEALGGKSITFMGPLSL